MQKVKQILKKILKIFFISILILIFVVENMIFLGIGFTFLFGDQVEDIIVNKINSKLKNELSYSEVEFSLFENFPRLDDFWFASVTFSDLSIKESFQDSSDPLLFAEKGTIKLNICNVIYEDYSIKNMTFDKAIIHIKYNESGESNFDILKDSPGENNNFELEKLYITNSIDSLFSFEYTIKK